MIKNTIIIMVILMMAGFAVYQSLSNTTSLPSEEAPKANFLTPSFELEALSGEKFSAGGQRDKAILINFWASWCEPCREEAPDLVKLYESYGNDLEIYGVNVFTLDNMRDLTAFVEEFELPFPILIDKKGLVSDKYNVMAYPTNVLVDRRGVIQEVILGIRPYEEMSQKIEKLIK